MKSQFEFYDFVAYLIPGILVLSICYWELVELGIYNSQGQCLGSIPSILFYLSGGYALGHIVQDFGSVLEKSLIRKLSIFKSNKSHEFSYCIVDSKNLKIIVQILNKYMPTNFINEIESNDFVFEKLSRKCRKELRRLCHELATQEGCSKRIDTLNGLYRFHRGIFVFILLAGVVDLFKFILVFINNALNGFQKITITEELIVILVPFIVLLIIFIGRRVNRFFSHFECAVFREVLIWHARYTDSNYLKNHIIG